jgi:hypothetical protein
MTQQRATQKLTSVTAADQAPTASRLGVWRRRQATIVRFVADGMGLSVGEAQVLIATTAASILVASAAAVSVGALRLLDFLTDG